MYKNTPVPKNTAAKIYALVSLLGGAFIFLSTNFWNYSMIWIPQLIGVILLVFAIYFASAYLLRRFTFSIEESSGEGESGEGEFTFRITELRYNRQMTLCLVNVSDIKLCRTVTPENRKKVKEEAQNKKRFTYDTAFAAPKQLELQMHVDDEDISMIITYDPDLVGVMNKLGVKVE